MSKWVCRTCDWQGEESQLLTAPNPFDQAETVSGCPRCKSIDSFREACDRLECWSEATIGTPTERGYERLCSQHGQPYLRARINTGSGQ
jgi:rubredoxin